MRVALVHQPYRLETGQAARDTGVWLGSRGDECELLSAFDLEQHDPSEFDLAVSFGGDGTTLRTARWAVSGGEGSATAAVPIVPIGMGKLSFLAELTPSQVRDQLDSYLGGDFWRDERTMLCLEVGESRTLALNDVVVARGAALRAVNIDLAVQGHHVTRLTADGVVVSTATGSTAYALSAGGPVMAPDMNAMTVVPIAAHLSIFRSLVLAEEAEVQLTVAPSQPAVASADGQVDFQLAVGEMVTVRVAQQRTVFARRGDRRDFYGQLTARLRRVDEQR